jgi:beta-glucosidase
MPEEQPLYRDASRPADERARDLLARMTVDEKLAQLAGVWSTALVEGGRFSEAKAASVLPRGTGHITRAAGSTGLRPAESARFVNACQRWLIENTRLGIPAIIHEESCAGYTASGGTCFPQAIGLAATWEPELVEEACRAIRTQMRAVGAHQALAPVLDVARDPRWGRSEETFGEDPYLISRMGVAYVRGMQGNDPKKGIVATGKHFAGYSASEGGLNWAPAHIGRRELLDVFVTPFVAAIREAGLGSIMNAYHEIDGVPCGASPELFEGLLRGDFGFDGVVVTDYATIPMLLHYHHLTDDKAEAARLALEAGLDVELPDGNHYREPLRQALADGRVDERLVDRSAARVLRMKFRLGLFEDPFVDADAAPAVFETPQQRELARRIAQKAAVLLKNEGGLLPLSRSLRKIAVIGPNADNPRAHLGDYHFPAHIEVAFQNRQTAQGIAAPPEEVARQAAESVAIVTVLEGIRSHAPDTEVVFAKGCDVLEPSTAGFAEAVDAARQAEVAIVVVGDRSGLTEGCTSGESIDRADLGLPGVQQALVEAVVATGTPTVVALANGRPYAIPWIAEHVPAVVEVWLSGEEGGNAIADVLFGDAAPGGKLPISFPRTVGQVPVYYAHKPSGGRTMWRGDYLDAPSKPLFPFGHGLSYTRFEYADLSLSAAELPATATLDVRCRVTNAGERAGEEVVQLYVRDMVGSVTRPVKELRGFRRIALAPGETRRLTFHLHLSQLAFHDRQMRFVVEPGEFGVYVGSSSEDIRLMASFRVTGEARVVRRTDVVPTSVETS